MVGKGEDFVAKDTIQGENMEIWITADSAEQKRKMNIRSVFVKKLKILWKKRRFLQSYFKGKNEIKCSILGVILTVGSYGGYL